MASLSKMPELVMENIIGFLDFRSVLTLRQVCRDFSNFIDDLKDSKLPDSKFKELKLTVKKGRKLEFKIEYFDGSIDIIEYMENSKRFKEKITNLENSNFLNVAIRNDLKWILKFQKDILDVFEIDTDIYSLFLQPGDEQFHRDVLKKLSNSMNNRKIKTKELKVNAKKNSEYLSIIQLIDPKFLVVLNFSPICLNFEIDKISKTEQWKMAQEFYCAQYFSDKHIKELAHFSRSSILTECVSAEDVIYLKECFVKSPTFQYCYLSMNSTDANPELFELWGPSDVSETDGAEKWYFRMENSDILVVRVEMQDTWPYRFYINFYRGDISDSDDVEEIIHD
ncbi:hypothetical protein B9Z55_021387 [Caenorhabditis nigoni]|uniref:F-box domain-containing protein n=1 Tax=Caenorhabditis nigoni TaxID=1611254 RepID=A0A2G5TRQ9_9PELO|nr:hypothetical protein B9Z55_021387 [Caenorhabditis nigoni]